jgi:hypothetical protein
MEAGDPVAREELAPTGPRQTKGMLEIRCRGGDSADGRRIERPAGDAERQDADHPAENLEPERIDVLVRDSVTDGV